LSRRFGSRLVRMGFKKGDVFGLVLPNIPEFPIALYGAAGTGMPVTLVNAIYTPGISLPRYRIFYFQTENFLSKEEMARQFLLSETSVIIGVSAMAATMRQVAQLCPSIRQIILVGESEAGFVSFKEMLDDPGDLFNDNLDVSKITSNFPEMNSIL
jgi:4-coumarate--CoA ligase